MEFDYTLDPINQTAKIVVSQCGCSETVFIEHHRELLPIIERLKKRQAELKKKLGITTKQQWKNRKYYNKYPTYTTKKNKLKVQRYEKDITVFQEMLCNGEQISKLTKIYTKLKRDNQKTQEIERS